MFKSVRLKLTLINITVVGIILLLFSSGTYILMKQNSAQQSVRIMYSVAAELRFRPPPRFPPANKRWANCFFVRLDETGRVLEASANSPLSEDELGELVGMAAAEEEESGMVKTSFDSYRFLRSVPPQRREETMIFLSMQPEYDTLARLRAILIFTGFAGILVVFVSSLFLADRALIPIKKSWERQKNFVADASHELRSPLAVIETNLELVMGNGEETVENQNKWLGNIQTENRRMSKLVSDLLFLARADSDQVMFEKRFFPLNDVLMEAVILMQPLADKKKIGLDANIKQVQDFYGDEARIKQLAVILVDNAIKYTHEGGSIRVGLDFRDSQFEITVADNGEGIAKEHLSRIFERFYRVDKARSREGGGTGLGLSIAEWIVKGHRGSISVSSAKGKGTTFKVFLPRPLNRGK